MLYKRLIKILCEIYVSLIFPVFPLKSSFILEKAPRGRLLNFFGFSASWGWLSHKSFILEISLLYYVSLENVVKFYFILLLFLKLLKKGVNRERNLN